MSTPGGQGVDLWDGLMSILIFVVGGFLALGLFFAALILGTYFLKVGIYKLLGKDMPQATDEEIEGFKRGLWGRLRNRR